jgi:Tfp pilus assembly protein PilV
MKFAPLTSREGFSIVEAAMAMVVIALFLGSMFALNSACLSLVRNAKDSASAMLSNQERVEQLRSCNWSQITDKDYVNTTLMPDVTQTGLNIPNATEIVRVTENGFLQSATASYYEVTRTPSGTSISGASNPNLLLTARMLKVDVTLNWTAIGGRTRTRASTSVIARGGLTINETTTIAPTVNW